MSYTLTQQQTPIQLRSKTRGRQTTAATTTSPMPRTRGENGQFLSTSRNLNNQFAAVDADNNFPGEQVDTPFHVRLPPLQYYTSTGTQVESSGTGGPDGPGGPGGPGGPNEPNGPARLNRNHYIPIPIPIPIPASIGSIIDMTTWAIAVTPNRIQFLRWFSLIVIKGLMFLTNLLFLAFAFMFLKTLPTWTGLSTFITAFWKCRPTYFGGGGLDNFQNIGQNIFPEAEILRSHSLQIMLYETADVGSTAMNIITIPLLVGNPIFWACAITATIICHGVLSFIHRCLDQSGRSDLADHVRSRRGDTN